jgi:hypothetical protein
MDISKTDYVEIFHAPFWDKVILLVFGKLHLCTITRLVIILFGIFTPPRLKASNLESVVSQEEKEDLTGAVEPLESRLSMTLAG